MVRIKSRATPRLFNDKAHAVLSDLIDATEDDLVKRRICTSAIVNDRLAYELMMNCAGLSQGATIYLPGDERVGTHAFLLQLRGSRRRLTSGRMLAACIDQLLNNLTYYFSNYLEILRIAYLRSLPEMKA